MLSAVKTGSRGNQFTLGAAMGQDDTARATTSRYANAARRGDALIRFLSRVARLASKIVSRRRATRHSRFVNRRLYARCRFDFIYRTRMRALLRKRATRRGGAAFMSGKRGLAATLESRDCSFRIGYRPQARPSVINSITRRANARRTIDSAIGERRAGNFAADERAFCHR